MQSILCRVRFASQFANTTRKTPVLVCAKAFHSTTFRHNSNSFDKSSAEPEKDADGPEVSDIEWEIRSGRAVGLIRDTLPEFFETGLIDRYTEDKNAESESIYSPRIQLIYTPPTRLPPFPNTLHIEGLPLYHASSVFVRTTLSMFYTDLRVELRRMQDLRGSSRERKFMLGAGVLGQSRMGGTKAEWDVISTYHISPTTGLVYKHVIESIYPAPHSSIYDALGSALGRFTGLKPDANQPVVPAGAETLKPCSLGVEGQSHQSSNRFKQEKS